MGILILNLFIIVIALIGLAGNFVVLWLVAFHMQKKTSFHVYIFNLASADFLFLCFRIIISLNKLTTLNFSGIFQVLLNCTYITALSILSAISIERYISVLFPIWYHCRRPRGISVIVCSLLWSLSLLLSVLEGNYCVFFGDNWDFYSCQVLDFITASWLIFSCVLLFGSSLALLVRVLCFSQRMKLTRLYVTIGLTVLVFLLCGLPFGIYWFLLFWIHDEFSLFGVQVVSFLSCINSFANPFVYFFVGSFRQKRQQALKQVLQRALEDSPYMNDSMSNPTQEPLQLERRQMC
ncbi:mas-related G-protein coupled receptor member X2-like [Suncus etruscus]|uniref:mas-related G-protein coupled receptor member X2-like n=1 Tax=Suncus etruscus TaxID=109475 RepID=UPI00210F28C0|nr:mas-related G-protein coupled receptor member X2-like [Suncus etruscus]